MQKLGRHIPLIALATAVILMIAGVTLLIYRASSNREGTIREITVQAEILAASIATALDFDDFERVQEFVNAQKVDPQIDVAAVYDESGKMVATFARTPDESAPPTLVDRETKLDGSRLSLVVPVRTEAGATVGYILLEALTEPIDRVIVRNILLTLLVVLAALVVAVLGYSQRSLSQVNRDLDARARELAEANRQLVGQIEEREMVEATLRQAQRLEAVGQLTSGVAHDFNNLLTVVLGNLGFLEKEIGSRPDLGDKTVRRLANMRTAAERGASLTSQLLAFSRRQQLKPKPVDLNESIGNLRDLLRSSIGGSVQMETSLAPNIWKALVDPTQIELVILNLAINARDAMQVGGKLTIGTSNVTITDLPQRQEEPNPGEYVVLSVADTGTGMTPEVLARAFEPFFTTKAPGKGSGLGLAQVFGFAKQSGGGVRIDTEVGRGTTLNVFLPRASGEAVAEAEAAPERAEAAPNGVRRVLIVDDDNAVREVTSGILEQLGYDVVSASDGVSALELLDRDGSAIDLAILDFAMPGMNGAQVAGEIREKRPRLPILFLTGFVDAEGLKEIGKETIIQKPFTQDDLAKRISRVFDRNAGARAGA